MIKYGSFKALHYIVYLNAARSFINEATELDTKHHFCIEKVLRALRIHKSNITQSSHSSGVAQRNLIASSRQHKRRDIRSGGHSEDQMLLNVFISARRSITNQRYLKRNTSTRHGMKTKDQVAWHLGSLQLLIQ